jgi:hypothetical protein
MELLILGGDSIVTNTSSYAVFRKTLKFTGVAVADDVVYMHDLIFNQAAFAGSFFFAGYSFSFSFWGTSILMNSGGIASHS